LSTKITFALEAERILKNIYINKKLVKEEIKKNGKYKPPGIFFRYYGYIYFKIRDMPINYLKLEDTSTA